MTNRQTDRQTDRPCHNTHYNYIADTSTLQIIIINVSNNNNNTEERWGEVK